MRRTHTSIKLTSSQRYRRCNVETTLFAYRVTKTTNLILAKNFPNKLCIGIVNSNIPIPAKQEGPIDNQRIIVVATRTTGPAHMFWINTIPFYQKYNQEKIISKMVYKCASSLYTSLVDESN